MYNKVVQEEVLKTTITKIRTYNDVSGWFVGDTDGGACVVGVAHPKPPTKIKLTLIGSWQNNAKWGKQFKVTAIKYESLKGAVLAMLKGGFLKFVKDSMAESIVNTLGESTFDVLNAAHDGDNTALFKFNAVKGVGKVTGPAILESWGRNRSWAENALLGIRAGLNLHQSKKASDYFGIDFKHIIYTNPYRLTVIRGITWETVDRIAQEEWTDKPAIPHDSPYRYAAAVREALSRGHTDGHVCLPKDEAIMNAIELATPHSREVLEPTVRGIAEEEELKFVQFGDAEYLYTKESYGEEVDIAGNLRILNKAQAKQLDWDAISQDISKYAPVELSPDQIRAVETAVKSSIMVMTGGPGTGKTTTLSTLTNIFQHNGLSITMCAPTGKAAIRMKEATKFPAQTIHKALGLPREENRLMTDVVIVDEASMIDQSLFLVLSRCFVTGSRFILVGDADQLPPVGAGEPFYQIIQMAELPVVRLNVIHRQGKNSGIVHVAHAFCDGIVPDVSEFDDCKFEYAGSNEQLPVIAEKSMETLMNGGVKQEDILLLTPLNGHDWGQYEINKRLKARYNPGLDEYDRMPAVAFDVEDPVIHTRNNYELGVMNGEIGKVFYAMTRQQEADAKGECEAGQLPTIVKVRYGEREVDYTREDIVDLKLAYSITIHKSQGSESQYVIMLVPSTHEGFELRQLAYTGLTRAKKYAHVISCENALQRYVGNTQRVRRHTNLASFMGMTVVPFT